MHTNQKLTKLIASRTINPPTLVDGKLHFVLDDGSILDVTPADGFTYPAGKSRKIEKVQQQENDLVFVLADGASIDIKTADANSSVFMKDKAGKFAFAG